MKRILCIASWGYLISVVALWSVMYFGGDRWWPATLILFGPRWAAALPLLVLVPLALVKSRFQLLPLLAAGIVIFGPFMGLHAPLGKAGPMAGTVLRVITCNIHNGSYSAVKLLDLIRGARADIVALQECPRDLGFTVPTGWHMVREGELVVLSRFPLQAGKSLFALHPPHRWPRVCLLQCKVKTPGGELNFDAVHLPSPRYGLQAILDRKTGLRPSRKGMLVSETSQRKITAQKVRHSIAAVPDPLVIAGDFNMPADSTIYREQWNAFTNAFSAAGFGYGWTMRGGPRGFEFGVRIDHVLVGDGLGVLLCEVGPDIGSDHFPLIADISFKTGANGT